MKISVIIPTRRQLDPSSQAPYFERAVSSVRNQASGVEIEVVIGVDHSSVPLGQAATVNEAVARADGDLLAILEDDDTWDPRKVTSQMPLLDQFDLITCNQRDVDEHDRFQRYSYYPTPSGWLMRRSVWARAGGMDTSLRFHVDADWLGRANQAGIRRAHIVHASADRTIDQWAAHMVEATVVVGQWTEPLVTRTVRPGSITGRIKSDPACQMRSDLDYATIRKRFGKVPW